MTEYWSPLERLLNDADDVPHALVEQHYVLPENEAAVRELLAEHSDTYSEDSDYDYYCQCGKWLEWNNYELPDHQSSVLDDAGLLVWEEGPRRPPTPVSAAPVPAAFQIPRRVINLTASGLDEFVADTTRWTEETPQ